MSKNMTIKCLAAMFFIALGIQATYAQPFYTETFSDQASSTANWVNGGSNAGAIDWAWTDVLNAGNYQPGNFGSPTGSSGYMWFDSDGNGNFTHDVTLTGVGAPANCTGRSNVHLRFYTLFRIFSANYDGQVGVSTDGMNFTYFSPQEFQGLDGSSAATDRFEGWVDLDVSALADNQPQVWVQFRWIGEYEYYWKVDDVEMYEFATPISDVTFQVNMALETVDPSGVFLNGPITGGTPEAMTDQGNGVWSITKSITDGETVEYRFENGMSPEAVDAACSNMSGFRTYTVNGTETLPAVCFASCQPCDVSCDQNPNAIICDNFDSYSTSMTTGQQASWWTTWSGTLGTAEDGIVSTEQAQSAPNSMKILATAQTGGPMDVVLDLDNQTAGNFYLKWSMFVPTDKAGYYNIQNVVPIAGGSWNLDVFFNTDSTGSFQIGGGASLGDFTYPQNAWFDVEHWIDLDNNLMTLRIDGQFVTKMAYPNNLGGVDFFGIDGDHIYYVDDVEFIELAPVVFNVDECSAAVDLSQFFGQPSGTAQTTGLFDNTNATVSMNDPIVDCWGENAGVDILDGTMWFTFTGDGNNYFIQTVPCNATNYIGTQQNDTGDTQMAIYAGDNCGDLDLVACNDDLFANGSPDWRAGLNLETEFGQNYYMLIDGFNFQGTVATGEFCIEITQQPSVTCADGMVGTYTVSSDGLLCFGDNLNTLIALDNPDDFVIPNVGPVFGMAWAITTVPVPANTWPANLPNNALVGSTVFLANPFVVGLTNNGAVFPAGQYYLTPIILGGGVDTDPANPARLFDVDPSSGCFFVGASFPVTLLPELDPLIAVGGATDEIVPPGGNGAVFIDVAGGIGEYLGDPSLYQFNWSNGEITQNIENLTAGTYTVTVSDPTGCVDDFVTSFTVGLVSDVDDPTSVRVLTISPNPTTGMAMINLVLESAVDVRLEVVNTLGQMVRTFDAGKTSVLNRQIDLTNLANGSYFVRITAGNDTAIRRIVVQR